MISKSLPSDPALSPSEARPTHTLNPVLAAAAIVIGLALFRLWYSTHIDLVPDEAYYWVWSKHLAASYRDKGPAIAWVIALGNWLFGDNVFGVRFFAVLFSAGTSWQLFTLARRLAGERTALWCLVLANIIPMLAIGSLLMTIDILSLFFWAWGMNVFWSALHSRKLWHWAGLGLIVGLGFLAKFTNGLQLVCIVALLFWSKPHRALWFSRQTVVMGLAFCLAILPVVWWNVQTGWIHAGALHSRSGVASSFHIRPLELLRFIGGQIGVLSPLIGVGMIAAVVGTLRNPHRELEARFLLSHFLPVYAVFGFFSLNSAGKENWAAPALLAGIVMLTLYWRSRVASHPRWRGWVGAALGLSCVMTLVLHNTDYLHLPTKLEPLRRAQGWGDFTAHVQRARLQHQPTLLIGNHYSQASMMQFYLPGHPTTYLPEQPYGQNQFTLWPTYQAKDHQRALYVTNKTDPLPDVLLRDFPNCEVVDDFWSMHQGRPMAHFIIYLCQRD
ncbi:MAG: glycosyltransferase family 39 protein [Verrucomicrobiota bacterium]